MIKTKKILSVFILFAALLGISTYIYSYKTADTPYHPTKIRALKHLHLLKYVEQYNNRNFGIAVEPAHKLLTRALMKIFGKKMKVITYVMNITSFFLAIFFIFLTVKVFFPLKTALFSIILFFLIPLSYLPISDWFAEYTQIFVTAAAIYFLIKSETFSIRLFTVLFALACSFGVSLKLSFILIAAAITLPSFFKLLKEKEKKNLINFSIFILLFFLIFISRIIYKEFFIHTIFVPFEEPGSSFFINLKNIRLFTFGLFEEQLSLPIFIFFLIAIPGYIKCKHNTLKQIVFMPLMVSALFYSFMPHWLDVRYILPIIPAYVLFITIGITDYLNNKKLKVIISILLLVAGIQYIDFNFDIGLGLLKKPFYYGNRDGKIGYFRDFPLLKLNQANDPRVTKINELLVKNIISEIKIRKKEMSELGNSNYKPVILFLNKYYDTGHAYQYTRIMEYIDTILWLHDLPVIYIYDRFEDNESLPENRLQVYSNFIDTAYQYKERIDFAIEINPEYKVYRNNDLSVLSFMNQESNLFDTSGLSLRSKYETQHFNYENYKKFAWFRVQHLMSWKTHPLNWVNRQKDTTDTKTYNKLLKELSQVANTKSRIIQNHIRTKSKKTLLFKIDDFYSAYLHKFEVAGM